MAVASFAYNGFTPYRHLTGGVIRANEYFINYTGSTGFNDNIFTGDIVKLNSDGTIESAAGGDTTLLGVFAGCYYVAAADQTVKFSPIWVASTAVVAGTYIRAMVYDDPRITLIATGVYNTQAVQTMVGANCDFVAGTGNTTTGISGSYLDTASVGSSTANFRILGFPDMPGNTMGATWSGATASTTGGPRVEVAFNEHLFLSTTGV